MKLVEVTAILVEATMKLVGATVTPRSSVSDNS